MMLRVVDSLRLIIICALLGLASYWLADRRPPVQQVVTEAINAPHPGEDLEVHTNVVRERQCFTRVERTLIDSIGYRFILPDLDFAVVGPIGPDDYIQRVPLPANIAHGKALIRFVLSYSCNPLQRVFQWPIVTTVDVPFLILHREPS